MPIANSPGMDKGDLLLLIKRYKYHGVNTFIKIYTTHSTQYKLDVLNFMNEHGTTIRETTAIRSWKEHFEFGGIPTYIIGFRPAYSLVLEMLEKSFA